MSCARRGPAPVIGRAVAVLAIAALAACAGPSASPSIATPSPGAAPSGRAATPLATASPEVSPLASPASPGSDATPTPAPTASTGGSPGAGACFGKPAQQQFFSAIAEAVTWDVYCAVLPTGWSVEGGTYHLAGGGRMEIAYDGPNGARFALEEGDFCTSGASACGPHDQQLGSAAYGDREGSLATLGPDMGFALYVDPGAAPMWQATGTGLDQATFVGLCAALVKVRG